MLRIPDGASTTGNIVGIDPGSNTLGVSCLTFDLKTFEIKNISAVTFVADRMFLSEFLADRDGARFARIKILKELMAKYFAMNEPFTIATESPFHNHLMPNAFGVLMEVMSGIRDAVEEYDPYMGLFLIPPSNVKNAVGAPGNARKEVMRTVIGGLFSEVLEFGIDFYDEHSIDAIAVAFARYKMFTTEHIPSVEKKKRGR